MNSIELAERGWLPDTFIRLGIRHLLRTRLRSEGRYDEQRRKERYAEVQKLMQDSPVAVATHAANQQHYEVPAAFYRLVLGPHLKYSCCYWPEDVDDLGDAEEVMLKLYVERAQLADGQNILELGCGWGSLTLWLARRFPNSRITAISNSFSQKAYIDRQAEREGLKNVLVITADMNHFATELRYDRIVTVEMLEHIRNYAQVFERTARWLESDGLMFAHIFCHASLAYPFDVAGRQDWMARYFFTGGMMPAYDTFTQFQRHLELRQRWQVPGWHYQRTADAWLRNLDQRRQAVNEVFAAAYGAGMAQRWQQRWRMFFMACSELFGYRHGAEWLVGHYLWGRG